jgi:hypothetical protein
MMHLAATAERVFKTAWFTKAARKALITDAECCLAIRQAMQGQVHDLGGGVFKKRLGKKLYRSIIVAQGGRYWVYTFLFAKQNQANIDSRDLRDFRALADLFARKTETEDFERIAT